MGLSPKIGTRRRPRQASARLPPPAPVQRNALQRRRPRPEPSAFLTRQPLDANLLRAEADLPARRAVDRKTPLAE